MKIEVFAILKDYFDSEFELQPAPVSIDDLKQQLIELRPGVSKVLSYCRFAVNDEFIDNSYQLNENDVISIIPPSSGG